MSGICSASSHFSLAFSSSSDFSRLASDTVILEYFAFQHAVKHEADAHLKAHLGLSDRRAYQIAGADRKSVRYQSQRAPDTTLRGGLRDLARDLRAPAARRRGIRNQSALQ